MSTTEVIQRTVTANTSDSLPIPESQMACQNLLARSALVQDVVSNVLEEGVHYGKIPGTNGVSLFKSGTEKLLSAFQIGVQPRVDDIGESPEIGYRVTVVGFHIPSGQVIGEGVGECHSQEEKYAWRKAVNRSEFEYTHQNRRRIKFKAGYQNAPDEQILQVRANPRDQANTILKMAKKRAQSDLVMTVLAASDVFDRDDGDGSINARVKSGRKAPAKQRPVQQQRPAEPSEPAPENRRDREAAQAMEQASERAANLPLTPEQIVLVRQELVRNDIEEQDLLDAIGVQSLEVCPAAKSGAIDKWISMCVEYTPR